MYTFMYLWKYVEYKEKRDAFRIKNISGEKHYYDRSVCKMSHFFIVLEIDKVLERMLGKSII